LIGFSLERTTARHWRLQDLLNERQLLEAKGFGVSAGVESLMVEAKS